MIECNFYQNQSVGSKYYGKWYLRNEPKGIVDPGSINLNTNIKAVRLVAQATGHFTKAELAKDARFRWTSKAQAEIDKWKEEHEQPEP